MKDIIERKAQGVGVARLSWRRVTQVVVVVQLLLAAFSGYYRPDFLTLAACAIALFIVQDPVNNVRYEKMFYSFVFVVLSLIYDVAWMYLIDLSRDEENGNTMRTPKQVSLYFSYASFFWKFPLLFVVVVAKNDFVKVIKDRPDAYTMID